MSSTLTPEPSTSGELDWHFSQVFGERTPGEDIIEADIISAVEFDQTGDYLATGDRGGRVVLFERVAATKKAGRPSPSYDERPNLQTNPYEYRYLTEFQSHEPEFDYLKSLEIEEKINKIRWLPQWRNTNSHMLLTTNDKTIKLWKVYERQLTSLSDFNLQNGSSTLNSGYFKPFSSPDKSAMADMAARGATAQLRLPKVVSSESVLTNKCRKTYSGAHTYHINSISLSSDQETFVSADDLRINLWHLDRSDLSYNIVDIKPSSMEDLTEVITCADFHPKDCHVLAYSSSKGCIRLVDMRASALCDQHAKLFEEPEPSGARSFFSEIIASINDVKFLADGRYILARDYMTLKLWDVNMEREPVAVYNVHEKVRSKLCDLYENDCIFDKFDCCASGDGSHFATGTYSNFFRIIPKEQQSGAGAETLLEASRDPTRRRLNGAAAVGKPSAGGRFGGFGLSGRGRAVLSNEDAIMTDFGSKVQHLAWHPNVNLVATAAANALYLFYGKDNKAKG